MMAGQQQDTFHLTGLLTDEPDQEATPEGGMSLDGMM